jgi:hypothetical protein
MKIFSCQNFVSFLVSSFVPNVQVLFCCTQDGLKRLCGLHNIAKYIECTKMLKVCFLSVSFKVHMLRTFVNMYVLYLRCTHHTDLLWNSAVCWILKLLYTWWFITERNPFFCIIDLDVLLCPPNFSCILSVPDSINWKPSSFMQEIPSPAVCMTWCIYCVTVIDVQEIEVVATCHLARTVQLAHVWEFTCSLKAYSAAICDL